MSYSPKIEKTLKVMSYSFPRPTSTSFYTVGTAFVITDLYYAYESGNLSDSSLGTHVNTNDTVVLPPGRYFIQSTIPVPEAAFSSSGTVKYVEWQNFYSNSLSGTYTSFGNKGRNNPGDKPSDTGDNPGVHSSANGIVESSSTIYLQTRIVTNQFSNMSLSGTVLWSNDGQDNIVIWRAD